MRKFADVQTWQSVQLGYWMDWDNSYHTMADENNYTIWHFLKVCHERGWIYEGTDVMPWCPRCGTGLSQHEIVTEGYKEIVHPGLYLRFPLVDREGESLLVWTTTPWTLTSNTGTYVHPELTYAKARTADGVFYLLKSRLSELKQDYELLEEMPGSALDGLRYRGPFDELPAQDGVEHRVVLFDDVSEREGTGVVHAAPGAGEADFELSKREGLTVIAPLNEFGVFVDGFDWLTGRSRLRGQRRHLPEPEGQGALPPSRVVQPPLPGLLALRHGACVQAGRRVVHLDGRAAQPDRARHEERQLGARLSDSNGSSTGSGTWTTG